MQFYQISSQIVQYMHLVQYPSVFIRGTDLIYQTVASSFCCRPLITAAQNRHVLHVRTAASVYVKVSHGTSVLEMTATPKSVGVAAVTHPVTVHAAEGNVKWPKLRKWLKECRTAIGSGGRSGVSEAGRATP